MNERTNERKKNKATLSWGIWHCLWEIGWEERRRISSFHVESCPIISMNLPLR